jgi:hypothetical protein
MVKMARPVKENLDYFPLDVHTDEKIEMIEAKYGLKGFAIIIKLYQTIYGGHGYYCDWSENAAFLFAKRNFSNSGDGGVNLINEVVRAALREGIFNEDFYKHYGILTSRGIQKRYFEAAGRRMLVDVKNDYLLVSVDKNIVNVSNNTVNVDINQVNVSNNTQKKRKEIKGNKKISNSHFVPPTPDEIKAYCVERKNQVDSDKFFDFYQSKGWMVGKNNMKDWKAAVRTWEKTEIKTGSKVAFSNQQNYDFKELEDILTK